MGKVNKFISDNLRCILSEVFWRQRSLLTHVSPVYPINHEGDLLVRTCIRASGLVGLNPHITFWLTWGSYIKIKADAWQHLQTEAPARPTLPGTGGETAASTPANAGLVNTKLHRHFRNVEVT